MSDFQANLRTFMLTQDFDPEHWNWDPNELNALSSCKDTAKAIVARFAAAGVPIEEAYAIEHNKDEKEIWDEYHNVYISEVSGRHIHFVAKLGKDNALPLERIALIAGVNPAFIERPRPGRYAYDNMLSYLIHIKYPSKYQYDPQAVITLAGKSYMNYYRDRHKAWMQGRAKRVAADSELKLDEVMQMIMDGKLSRKDLLTDPQYKYVYILNKRKIDTWIKNALSFRFDQQRAEKGMFDDEDEMTRGTQEVSAIMLEHLKNST